MSTSKVEIVAAAVKKFRQMINDYQGPPDSLRHYLLKRLSRPDELLADVLDEIL